MTVKKDPCNNTLTLESSGKLHFLEGIRGLMALSVVVNHFVVIFFPQMFFRAQAESMGGVLSLFAKTPLSALVNGNIAVQYFFLLTGFLVGRSCFTKEQTPNELADKAANRYFRLLPVVFVSTLVTCLTIVFGLMTHRDILDSVANPEYLAGLVSVEPTVSNFLRNAFLYPFLYGYSQYVGPFWTLRYELFGYLLCLPICYIFRNCTWRKLAYLVIGLLCFLELGEYYLTFIMGIFIADLCCNPAPDCFEKLYRGWAHSRILIGICLLAGLYFACCPMYFATIYSFWERIPQFSTELLRGVGVALLLYALLHFPKVQKALSNRFLVFLGKISFEVYGLHMSILLSLLCWLFSLLLPVLGYAAAALTAFMLTLPVIYLAAYLAWRLVEKDRKYDITRLFRVKHTKSSP